MSMASYISKNRAVILELKDAGFSLKEIAMFVVVQQTAAGVTASSSRLYSLSETALIYRHALATIKMSLGIHSD